MDSSAAKLPKTKGAESNTEREAFESNPSPQACLSPHGAIPPCVNPFISLSPELGHPIGLTRHTLPHHVISTPISNKKPTSHKIPNCSHYITSLEASFPVQMFINHTTIMSAHENHFEPQPTP